MKLLLQLITTAGYELRMKRSAMMEPATSLMHFVASDRHRMKPWLLSTMTFDDIVRGYQARKVEPCHRCKQLRPCNAMTSDRKMSCDDPDEDESMEES